MFYLENKLKKSIFYPEKIEGVYFLSRKKFKESLFYLEKNLKELMLFYLEKTDGVYVNESRSLLLPDNETIINLVNTCRVVKHVKQPIF